MIDSIISRVYYRVKGNLIKKIMTQEEVATMARFLRWICEKKNVDRKARDGNHEKLIEAKQYCREQWDRYGYKIVKKALNHTACVSLSEFLRLCRAFKEMENNR